MKAAQCRPDTVDASKVAAALARIKDDAVRLVATHPLVLRRAGGIVRQTSVAAIAYRQNQLPNRLTVTVDGATGSPFHAEVDVATAVNTERELISVRTSLACLTGLWLGNRTVGKDICISDANAQRPD